MKETNLERDLGLIVGSDLKRREHVDIMVGKANRTLGMLKRTFERRKSGLWKYLYVSLLRPHLEYAAKAWNLHLQGENDKTDRVKRRAARILTFYSLLNNIVTFPSLNFHL